MVCVGADQRTPLIRFALGALALRSIELFLRLLRATILLSIFVTSCRRGVAIISSSSESSTSRSPLYRLFGGEGILPIKSLTSKLSLCASHPLNLVPENLASFGLVAVLSHDTKSIGLFAMSAVVAPGAVAVMTRALTSDRPRMSNSSKK